MEKEFIPQVGMIPEDPKSPGYVDEIECVGEDYFVLRSYRTGEPVIFHLQKVEPYALHITPFSHLVLLSCVYKTKIKR